MLKVPVSFGCREILLAQDNTDTRAIFGRIDSVKFCSCLTLFAEVAPDEPLFQQALNRFYDGNRDALTLSALQTKE